MGKTYHYNKEGQQKYEDFRKFKKQKNQERRRPEEREVEKWQYQQSKEYRD